MGWRRSRSRAAATAQGRRSAAKFIKGNDGTKCLLPDKAEGQAFNFRN
jgi:hypothetical protein